MTRKLTGVLAAIGLALLTFVGVPTASAANTVEISGKAFVFNHMNTGIPNATIKVREFPKLSAVTDELGDYAISVPDDANVTPYIESGGPFDLTIRNRAGEATGTRANVHWNEIDLQTFHTRGENIENANFQSPQDFEYNFLKGLLGVPAREDGRPQQCVIVTTASARNVRDTDFATYWLNTPHGVEGATSIAYPAIDGPVYFNEQVQPDPNQPHASNDGGIIWPVVPTGTYRIVTSHPDTQFASFLATCAPGRVVNANPPMGAYQLDPGEAPRTFSNVAANLGAAKVVRKGKKQRLANLTLTSGEAIDAKLSFKVGKQNVSRSLKLKAGNRTVKIAIKPTIKAKQATVKVELADVTGVSFTSVKKVKVPALPKAKKKAKKAKKKASGKRR